MTTATRTDRVVVYVDLPETPIEVTHGRTLHRVDSVKIISTRDWTCKDGQWVVSLWDSLVGVLGRRVLKSGRLVGNVVDLWEVRFNEPDWLQAMITEAEAERDAVEWL